MKISYTLSGEKKQEKKLEKKGGAFIHVTFAPESATSHIERGAQGGDTLVIGTKETGTLNTRKVRILVRRVVREALSARIENIAFDPTPLFSTLNLTPYEQGRLFAENALMAEYEFVSYRTTPTDGWPVVAELALPDTTATAFRNGVTDGLLVGAAVNATRDLANIPGGDMTPSVLATQAHIACKGTGVKVTVLDKAEMTKRKMGAVLGVAQGSSEEPKFIILEYYGGAKKEKPVVLVGKGVTFDTGGLNLKPSDHILDMNLDMSGGAAVIHTLALAGKLKLKKNIIGLIPAVENMPSGSSYRPGDILRTMSGKTIEVLNTDAEGRVILADALLFAKQYNPKLVVDVATLTGAALVALGTKASALMTRDEAVAEKLLVLGEESGEYLWRLPLWEEYEAAVKGRFGDVANIPVTNSRDAGSINGGMFLLQFAEGYPWAHIDMAPRMTADADEYLAKGAVGSPVRLLIRIAEQW